MTLLSLLDFATIFPGERPSDSFARSVEMARRAEKLGYERIWYAEHHNMRSIASSAPAVLIAHIGAHTQKIRLGAGGVMLPNHAPLTVAEQFGTLAEMYPGRIDLGLGRAPGTDMRTLQALRRSPNDAERFPQDVKELQGYLTGNTLTPGVRATPGNGTNVPLYILGSSLFGASLAAALGLPYAFASHFAPTHLEAAVKLYRQNFQPSDQLAEPYAIAAANVIAADSLEDAKAQQITTHRQRVKAMMGKADHEMTDEQLDALVNSAQGQQIIDMMRYTALGTAKDIRDYLTRFADMVQADELMISNLSPTTEQAYRGLEILAEAMISKK
ncbi:MAG: LLM class flavin-dependent oxidoreductase [Rothia sp. (in: high G+C Gram-positive bacteria)]|nr:LLM class flavin-dependent oxidoreductase [Rothia sp. (in: high G+C Gram-positive bacteria)]